MVGEDNAQSIRTFQVPNGVGDGFNRAAVVVVIQQSCNDFCIRIAGECYALCRQIFFQFFVVFNNAVMNNGHSAACMRMRVDVRWFAMGCPASMSNASVSLWSAFLFHFMNEVC